MPRSIRVGDEASPVQRPVAAMAYDRPSHSHRIHPTVTHRVAALVYDDLNPFEFGCLYEVFQAGGYSSGETGYDFFACSMDLHVAPMLGPGVALRCERGLSALASADTIIVPGWPVGRAPPAALLSALRDAHARGARLASTSSGAFVLAATGLLDGRRATTHWLHAERFSRLFPSVRCDPGVLYVEENRVVTSAGGAAGIDMLLDMVRNDYGSEVCNRIARRLISPPHRSGDQAQVVERLVPKVGESSLQRIVEWMRAHANETHPIGALARQAGMSSRTFFRKFRETMGVTPQEFILQERVAIARNLLERDKLDLTHVAERSGFLSLDTLRHHFKRIVGQSPTEYRRRFAQPPMAP